jgi:hypothetical protein
MLLVLIGVLLEGCNRQSDQLKIRELRSCGARWRCEIVLRRLD